MLFCFASASYRTGRYSYASITLVQLTCQIQFTLFLYEAFVKQLETDLGKQVQTGEFGADMKVDLRNDGPVTIIIDTKQKI